MRRMIPYGVPRVHDDNYFKGVKAGNSEAKRTAKRIMKKIARAKIRAEIRRVVELIQASRTDAE
jgi:hypothetical protein